MRYRSTRDATAATLTLGPALERGLAPDGGLYVPQWMPSVGMSELAGLADDLPALAARLLAPFADGDSLAAQLDPVSREAFDFEAPLVPLAAGASAVSALELFHGPTAAFKDFGARFLAASLERLPRPDPRRLTVLVATSGDTGGAVAAAFHGRPWVDVVVLYPRGLVSKRQEKQLACWGGNVRTLSVRGRFDDCQRMVKEAFVDPALGRRLRLSSANSINVGRLLPQMSYYVQSSLRLWRDEGRRPNYIVPTGNLGNAVACLWARAAGAPIGEVVLATNANRTIPDFLASGEWRPRASVATLASAMDVGNPSNVERLRDLYPALDELRGAVSAVSVTDAQIRETIARDHGEWGRSWCPHSATAAWVYRQLPEARRRAAHWVLVATAHPAKFEDVVEPLIGTGVPVPPALARLLELPSQQLEVEPELAALRAVLDTVEAA